MSSLLRHYLSVDTKEADPLIVSAMGDYGIEINKINYNAVCGATQLFMNQQYEQSASLLKDNHIHVNKHVHHMLSQLAMKVRARDNDSTYGCKHAQ